MARCAPTATSAAILAAAIATLGSLPIANAAVSEENFQLRATRDLAALCSAERTDPRYSQAIHFCQGYLVGLYHYHQALTAERRQAPVFCIAGPEPTRDEAVASFLAWSRARPQHMDEAPIDGVFRWAVETWPCQRAPRRARR